MLDIWITVGVILVAIIAIGLMISRLYRRASKEVSFVRTGLKGQLVVMNGGAMVFPVLHEIIPVNMNTLRLEVRRANEQALITRDRMRVDVLAEFYVRVQPTEEAIADAAQTLGRRTMQPEALKELVEGKFVDALRAVAAEMSMEELHEQRVQFVQKVQQAVSEDLLKNGLELESVSLTGLDQTNREFFNPDNAFDAAGLTKLTQEIEDRRKHRNDIEQDTLVAIEQKNLEAEQLRLTLARDKEYAQLEQTREVEVRRAAQKSDIAREQANRQKEAEEADILAKQSIQLAQIQAAREIEQQNIEKERLVRERDIDRERAVEVAEQEKTIVIAEKSKQQSEAKAEADKARAAAVKAEELVQTVRETERSERQKAIDLIEAQKVAERDAIAIQVKATAEKTAAEDDADAIRTRAEAHAQEVRITAQGESEAEMLKADAAERRYAVEAEGQVALNEADNRLSADIVQMKLRLALIEQMQNIIRESVKPMENIDSIKILQVDGLNGAAGAAGPAENGSPSDQIVQSALKYRAQAPLVDALLNELGFAGADPAAFAKMLGTDETKASGKEQTKVEGRRKQTTRTQTKTHSTEALTAS
ncbi:MAG: flotillin domain-containing protein [Pseudomonadota bacterium]